MRLAMLVPLALLAACGSKQDTTGGLSADDQRALNEAAASLDVNAAAASDAEGNGQ